MLHTIVTFWQHYEPFLSYIWMGSIDNGLTLLGVLTGIGIEARWETRSNASPIIGALLGNCFATSLGGVLSFNFLIGLGTFIGCGIPLIIYMIIHYRRVKK